MVYGWEVAAIEFFQQFQHPFLTQVVVSITDLGSLPLVAFIFLLVFLAGYEKLGEKGLFAVLSTSVITVVLKYFFSRPLPELMLEVNPSYLAQYGFPSGHTAVAFTAAVVLDKYFDEVEDYLLYGAAGVVGVTRVYLGAHYPLDVVAGAALGLFIGYVTVLYYDGSK